MPVPQIVTKDVWGAVERVESLRNEVLLAWRMAGNLNYRQARQEAHQISGRNLLPGLPVIQISCHSSKLSKRAKLHWLNFQLSPQLPTHP